MRSIYRNVRLKGSVDHENVGYNPGAQQPVNLGNT